VCSGADIDQYLAPALPPVAGAWAVTKLLRLEAGDRYGSEGSCYQWDRQTDGQPTVTWTL